VAERAAGTLKAMAFPEDRLEVLDRRECLELLASVDVGRLAWARTDGRVQVRPVNFVLDRGDVMIRCRAGSMLDAVRGGRAVAFEADELEPALRAGWSVLIVGTAREVSPATNGERWAAPAEPWAGGPRPHVVRVHGEEITGRRLRLTPAAAEAVYLEPDP
jgi:nitroimidazol reductase NimA-like FMN-containing flavoprotein (pyridoxamine 5'-phosphate oxidase superfamily)